MGLLIIGDIRYLNPKDPGHSLRSVATHGRKSGHWVPPYALSISYCVKNSKSIKIEQFVEWFKDDFGGMGVHVLRLVSYTIELVLFGYLIPFAYHFVRASYMGKAASPAVGIPMWIVQSITVISFGLCEIRLLQKLISRIGMIRRGEKEKKGEE